MTKNINKIAFEDATKLKLKIFGECFEEWLPVFNNTPFIKSVYVFDFFAGSGKDAEENSGSPLILLDKAKGKERQYCWLCFRIMWNFVNIMYSDNYSRKLYLNTRYI